VADWRERDADVAGRSAPRPIAVDRLEDSVNRREGGFELDALRAHLD
jgi:hypothetical protein